MAKEKVNKTAETTPEEQNFQEHQNARQSKVKRFFKRLKWYHILVMVLFLIVVLIFGIWHLKPKKQMNVVVLDKTVLSYANDENIVKNTVYRKHQGLYWILHQQRYVKPDGSYYDYQRDYYGPKLDDEGNFDHDTNLKDADSTPDLLYLSDAYGLGNDTFGHYNGGSPLNGGITDDDMSYISFAHESGATIIAESTFFSSPLSDSVRAQLTTLTGVNPTKWIGRYLVDLQDFTDVPDWAPPMYEQQEGVEWRFTGPGILLVSSDGKIIILEQNTDFRSQNLLSIYLNDEYKNEFWGCDTCNFYNWFELVEPNYGVENIATFEFDLNATGMEKISEVSKTPRFCAISRKQEEGYAPVYYFAGDCNDYVNGDRYGEFLFANQFFKFLSYDRQGDISNFFWRFYNPLMRHILSVTESRTYQNGGASAHKEVSRVNNGSFQVLEDEKWRSLTLKATALNAQEPGKETYSRDFTYYENLVESAGELGVNCLVAKDLLPPEFYGAVSRYNKNPDNKTIYILQRVTPPDGLNGKDYLTDEGLDKWSQTVTATVKALHGDGQAKSEKLGEATYFIDVSEYVLGVCVDPKLKAKKVSSMEGLDSYSYDGDYVNANTGVRGFAAYLYDTAQKVSRDNYGYYTPISVSGAFNMIKGRQAVHKKNAYVFEDIESADCEDYYFCDVVVDNDKIINSGRPDSVYSKYLDTFRELGELTSPVLASGVSFSNVNEAYNQDAVSETEQGERLVETLSAAKDSGILGATIYDLNDSWSDTGEDMEFYTASGSNSYLWHNTCDSAEMTGIIAMDSVMPETPGLVLSDDDLVQAVSMYNDAGYMYITLQLLEEIDYKENAMFVGLDTFQRNDGEYYYAKDFTANSLSGMEYSLRFDGKQEAALYVIDSYDRSHGSAVTKESYSGKFSKVADLSYGGFTSGDTQFYQTGSTIYIRLPWTWLNVADPSKKLVINDKSFNGDAAKTVTTNGVLPSVMIGERKEGDLMYAFPIDKHDPGYKVFQWQKWDTVEYASRNKESFEILKKYFLGQK